MLGVATTFLSVAIPGGTGFAAGKGAVIARERDGSSLDFDSESSLARCCCCRDCSKSFEWSLLLPPPPPPPLLLLLLLLLPVLLPPPFLYVVLVLLLLLLPVELMLPLLSLPLSRLLLLSRLLPLTMLPRERTCGSGFFSVVCFSITSTRTLLLAASFDATRASFLSPMIFLCNLFDWSAPIL